MFKHHELLTSSLLFLLLAAVPASVRAESIILSETGPSASQFQPGQKLSEEAVLKLATGDRLTILRGEHTMMLHGPFAGMLRSYREGDFPQRKLTDVLRIATRPALAAVRDGKVSSAEPKQLADLCGCIRIAK